MKATTIYDTNCQFQLCMEMKVYVECERKLRVKLFLCYFKEFILLFFRVSAEIIEFSMRYPKTGFFFRQDTETVRRSNCYFYWYTAPAIRLKTF